MNEIKLQQRFDGNLKRLSISIEDYRETVQHLLVDGLRLVAEHGDKNRLTKLVELFAVRKGKRTIFGKDGASVVGWLTKHGEPFLLIEGRTAAQFTCRPRARRVRERELAKVNWVTLGETSWYGTSVPTNAPRELDREEAIKRTVAAFSRGIKANVLEPTLADIDAIRDALLAEYGLGMSAEQLAHDAMQSTSAKKSTAPTEHADEETGELADQVSNDDLVSLADLARKAA